MGGSRLAILIPAHREAATIGSIVEEARLHGEVIVIDDCSPDDTAGRVRAAGGLAIRSECQLGYQAALAVGFQEAERRGFTHVVTMDADGEHDPKLLSQFRDLLLQHEVPLVLGFRPRKQRFAESIFGWYARARYGVRDILCGMKGYDMALYRINGGFSRSETVGTELAMNSLRRGARCRQIPVSGRKRADQPRFNSRLRANLQILGALRRIIVDDFRKQSLGNIR